MRKNIIPCNVGTPTGPHPKTLREVNLNRIIGRKITLWSPDLGSYGMGGCGLFGARLSKTSEFPEEWLILMFWGAPDWLLFDGKVASSGVIERQMKRQEFRCKYRIHKISYRFLLVGHWIRINLLGWQGLPEWDNFSRKIIGTTIVNAEISDNSTMILLQKGSKKHMLEISVPSRWQWNDEESHLDAWAISDTDRICC